MRNLKTRFLLLFVLMTIVSETIAHSVQIAYCVSCNGNLRIFVEHWHGAQNPSSTNMTIQLTINGVSNTQTNPPVAGIMDIPFGSLPGCSTPVTYAAGCNGQQNTYNDWVYYDYFGIPAGVPCSFTILSGNNTFTSDGCGMYPLTVNFTVPPSVTSGAPITSCLGQNLPAFAVPAGTGWTNSNPAIGIPASGTGPVAAAPSTGTGTSVFSYTNGCGIQNTTITVTPGLPSVFNHNSGTGVCLGTPITFNNTTPGATNTYTWNMGSGPNIIATNVNNFVYPAPGTYTVSLTVANPTNVCLGISSQTVRVHPMPSANFTIPNGCMNTNLTTVNTSSVLTGTNNYTWTMTGATPNTSNATNVTVQYPASGIFTINLNVLTNNGCPAAATRTVSVFGNPVADFAASNVCFNSVTNFTNLTSTSVNPNTSAVASYSWNFGATSGTSSAVTPVNTYTNPANLTANTIYSVTLLATTANGCTSTITKTLTVFSLPTASFTSDQVCQTNSTSLTHVGSGNGNPISNFAWDFNNNNVADMNTVNTPTFFVFPNSGVTTVNYTVFTNPTGTLNCRSVFTNTVFVYPGPQAIITNTNACFGLPIGLSGVTSTLSAGTITNYAWSYGNGNQSLTNPTPSTSALYAQSGIYTVTLTVGTSNNCFSTATKTIEVFGRAVLDFTPNDVCFNTPTTFTNLTTTTVNASTGAVASYSWNFGAPGGGSSTLPNPVFSYTNPANATANLTYTATLYATTVNGCRDSLRKTVTVYSLPTPNFVADSVCLGNQTTLTNTGNGNGNPQSNILWDFYNNGTIDQNAITTSAVHTFTNFGNNPVSYTITSAPAIGLSCRTSTLKNVWVHPRPQAFITNVNTCLDTQPSQMSGVSSTIAIGTITNYAWNYSNIATSLTNATPATSYSFNSAGFYNITLTVTSNAGCINTNTANIEVYERPYGQFAYSKTCFRKTTTLNATQAAVSGSIASYQWDFNNNISSVEATGASVTNTFLTEGTNTVTLLMTTIRGCTNSISMPIYINYLPRPNFYAPKRAGCTDLCIPVLDSSAVLTGPAVNTNWQWTIGNGQTFNNSNGNLSTLCFTNKSNTDLKRYDIKLILTSDSGCVDSITKRNYITVYPKPVADFQWRGIDGNILTPEIEFTNTSIGANSFHWFFNDGKNVTDSSQISPKHYFNTDEPKDYRVWLAVRNTWGCKDTVNRVIEIGPDYTFYIPNAFTPNGDGVNDTFTATGIGIEKFTLRIFDRWGELIYMTSDINEGWDGKVKGKYPEDKMDVYQWKVNVTDKRGKERQLTGHVTLLK
ncbi:MAG: PKD domain-containing protein [Bacteroidota bacterium]